MSHDREEIETPHARKETGMAIVPASDTGLIYVPSMSL